MKKFIVSLSLLLLALVFNTGSVTFAEEMDNTLKIKEIREYIDESVVNINLNLSKLNKSSSLEEVEAMIDNYYSNNTLPGYLLEDEDLNIDNIYSPENSKSKNNNNIINNETLNLEEVLSYAKENEEKIYEFSNENSNLEVYVAETGGIIILERSSTPDLISSFAISPFAQNYTKIERTTGILYNSVGGKLVTLWAEGSFSYDGETVKVLHQDGNISKHPLGSLIVLEKLAVGKDRPANVGFNKYVEVYSRTYFESNIAFTFGNITLKTGTIEVYVGAAPTGSVYGGLKTL